jgi:hypothetical protein
MVFSIGKSDAADLHRRTQVLPPFLRLLSVALAGEDLFFIGLSKKREGPPNPHPREAFPLACHIGRGEAGRCRPQAVSTRGNR